MIARVAFAVWLAAALATAAAADVIVRGAVTVGEDAIRTAAALTDDADEEDA